MRERHINQYAEKDGHMFKYTFAVVNNGISGGEIAKDAVNSLSQGTSVESALKTVDDGFKQVFARFNIAAPQ